jgi:AcrR family transcriptional regulator
MAYQAKHDRRDQGETELRARRPRRIDKERRQSEILDAAFKLFAKKGFGSTRIDEIAKQAGVAKGLVLFHFKSKEDVFQAVVRRAIPPLLDKLDMDGFESETDAVKLLREALHRVYQHLVVNPHAKVILQLLVAEGHRFPKLKAFYHSDVVARGNAMITQIVALGVKQGKFSAKIDANLPRILLGPLVSALFWQILFVEFEKIDIEELFESHIDLMLHGLIGPRPSSKRANTR